MRIIEKVYIVAGSHNQFRDYEQRKIREAIDNQTPCPYYVCVSNINTLMGLSDIKGFYIGTYEQRPDIKEIKQQIDIIKWKFKGIAHVDVHITGIRQNIVTDYMVTDRTLSQDSSKLSEVTIEFTQAPPKGSPITISNVKGDNFFVVGNGSTFKFHAVFP